MLAGIQVLQFWQVCYQYISTLGKFVVNRVAGITATSWNGYGLTTGTVSLHSWKGRGKGKLLGAVSGKVNARRYNAEMKSELYDSDPEEDGEED